jgi:hypothetical protein
MSHLPAGGQQAFGELFGDQALETLDHGPRFWRLGSLFGGSGKGVAALGAEAKVRGRLEAALSAGPVQRLAALWTDVKVGWTLELTLRTKHLQGLPPHAHDPMRLEEYVSPYYSPNCRFGQDIAPIISL